MDKADNLKFKYESLTGWIEKADTKAQILIGIQLFILGYVIEKQTSGFDLSVLKWVFLVAFLVCSLCALYYLYRVIRPRLANKISHSRIYFRDLAKQAEQDKVKTKQALVAEEEVGFIDDMADQVLALAKVCNEKHEFLFVAEKFMVASFLIGLSIYFLSLFNCAS